MSLQVSFRVVGLYCYFENLHLPSVHPTSTIQQVMDALKIAEPTFNYSAINMDGKEIVNNMSYNFGPNSKTPYNSSRRPDDGPRDLSNHIGDTSLVWQYYRSVTGIFNRTVCEIKCLSQGQPSFSTTALNYYDPFFGAIPPEFNISTYNLTWRLIQVRMSPEKQAKFMLAQAKALQEKN